jgi:WXG100 family type VII secretion target
VPAPIVRADYEQLRRIAKAFAQQSEACRQSLYRLQSSKNTLQGGDWVGRGAGAFYAEMDSSVLPSLKRLAAALDQSSRTVSTIHDIFSQAEQDAAALFRLDLDGSTAAAWVGDYGGWPKWLTDLWNGVVLGDFSEDSSLLKLLAQIGVGFVPYAGQIADARDIIASIKNVIQGKELAWVGLGLATLAIIPGLDALKAGKVLRPIFRAMGDRGSRQVVEFLLKNPSQAGRVARTLTNLLDHPQLIEALANNPDAALRLIREGTPEVVEAYGRYGEHVSKILNDIPQPSHAYEGFDRLVRQRPLDPVPGSYLTPEVGRLVTPGVHGDFNQFSIGTRGDFDTKLLWTIDDQGAHFVPEHMLWDSTRKMPSHTNISDAAYFGGEAWRTGPNEVTINAGSGAFGYNRDYAKSLTGEAMERYVADMQARFDRAAEYFRQLGFEVRTIPLTER